MESVAEYTLGVSSKFFPNERWQHSFVAGVDGYVLNGVPDDRSPIPFTQVATLDDAEGSAARATLRASSVRKLELGPRVAASLTFAAEQSVLRERAVVDAVMPHGGGPQGGATAGSVAVVRWRGNSGFTTQLNGALFDHTRSRAIIAPSATHPPW